MSTASPSTDPSSTSGLAALVAANPWPDVKPDAPESTWGWGIEGPDLLAANVPNDAAVILEIGSLLGASARFFAKLCPRAHLICVDPWFDVDRASDRPFLEHAPELADYVTGTTDGIFRIFLASNWELRHRLTPLRGYSPDLLAPVHRHGIEPAAVYIDGSHVYEDVLADAVTARTLWPRAVLCGDDWNWPGVQHAISYLAVNRGDEVVSAGNTWVLRRRAEGDRDERFPAPSARTVGPVERSGTGRLLHRLLVAAGRRS